jgi:twitching motility two-component system response regulator PilG
MQGNIREIDIRSILQLIELGQRTGLLFVETFGNQSIAGRKEPFVKGLLKPKQHKCWFVFFLNGKIIYATDGGQNLSRLDDYLRHYRVKVRIDETQLTHSIAPLAPPEYNYLWALLEQGIIHPTQAKSIIQGLVYETIFDLLNLEQGNFIFEVTSPFTPQLATWKTSSLVLQVIRQVQEWKLLYPHIQSPDQLPMLSDVVKLRNSLPKATANKLKQWADGKTSLRQLTRYLNRDILTVAKAIYPYVQQGWVHLVYTDTINVINDQASAEDNSTQKIVCINTDTDICKSLESIFKSSGFDVRTFTSPLVALNQIFALKPNLILCDITMPELEGTEICAMLRQSKAFCFLPIIILKPGWSELRII